MAEMWRVMDTGLRGAAQNIALDRALLEARNAEEIPSTLRFYRFTPAVLLGSRHSPAHESDVDYCRAANIAIQRRISSGDPVYCDRAQLGWALYLHRRDVGSADMQAVARRIGHAVAGALGALGVAAGFRAPQDIEAGGRRLGAAGGVLEGNALLYQGLLQIDQDLPTLLQAMRTPAPLPLEQAVAAARERMTDLKSVLDAPPDSSRLRDLLIAAFESEFAAEFHDADLSLTEDTRYQHALAEIDTPDWINLVAEPAAQVALATATLESGGNAIEARVLYESVRQRIKQVWFAVAGRGEPAGAQPELEAVLANTAVDRLDRNIRGFFSTHPTVLPALTPADYIHAMRRALKLPLVMPNSQPRATPRAGS